MTSATVAGLLRAYRIAARLTQAELAERARISERAVSDIERGLRRRVYPVTARALADALELDPDDRAAFEAAAAGRGNQAGPSRPAPGDDWRGLRRTPMVGRDEELAELLSALQQGTDRLVTITGTGGIGKSRLAAEACARIGEDTPADLIWVGLAGLRQPELLLATVAAAIGVSAAPDKLLPALTKALEQRGALLVLDTFEPVLPAAPDVAAVLDQAPGLRVLVTSRAPLRLRGERELPLRSLSEPAAAALFRQRARAVRLDLALDDVQSVDEVARICRRLSCLPLALELAAAKVRHMSLPALRTELDRPLRLLTGGGRDLPERQQTIYATIAWSHALLDGGDRVFFRRLAAFAGGWTLQAAESLGEDVASVLESLGRLCEHGLVQADTAAVIARWYLLDPIREYAAEQLADSGEADEVARRHTDYYATLAETAAPRLLGGDQTAARAELHEETANLRTAVAWAVEREDADLALRLAGALWMFWRMESAFDEGRMWLRRALDITGSADSQHRPVALWGAAWLAYQQGDLPTATELGEELLSRSIGAHTALNRRNALTILGHIAMAQRRYDDALPLLEEALDIARAGDATWHIATSLLNLGTALLRHGDPQRAQEVLTEAVAAHRAAGDRHFVARSLVELAYASLVRNDADRAAGHLGDALRTFLALDERWGVAEAVAGFAVLAAVRGQAETAALLSGASDAAYAEIAAQVIAPDAALAAPFLTHARMTLGDARWQLAADQGHTLVIEDAAQLALDTLTVVPFRGRRLTHPKPDAGFKGEHRAALDQRSDGCS